MSKASITFKPITGEQVTALKQLGESAGRHAAELALKRIPGISREQLQKALGCGDRVKSLFADALIAALPDLAGLTPPDPRYKFVKEFEIIVPEKYAHDTHLDSFRAKHRTAFYGYNDAITDANFSGKATTKLVPGQLLKVAVYDITKSVTSEDNMKFIASQDGILTGAHGASLAWDQRRDELPKGRWYISFDKKEVLWKDADGYHRVPRVSAYSDGVFDFGLGYFERDWVGSHSLLVFRDESLGT